MCSSIAIVASYQQSVAPHNSALRRDGFLVTALVTGTDFRGIGGGWDCFRIQQLADPTGPLNPVRIPRRFICGVLVAKLYSMLLMNVPE
jgi:hypothetical protein